MVEARPIQPLDPVARQEIPVRDERRNHPATANVGNDRFQVGVQQRLTAAERYDASPELRQPINALQQIGCRHRL
jgi:hypothetical protein